ncbi:hypothetical protein CC80DRAFT_209527 [Byssothecium circinans]|uniref:Putative zinc-finger domain-containing protein n=1 Tax=Byssothecium circinans TaxID=147558 RepID=A0A6A5TI34_9PLEO|nr:hypothetical protein CC80DRAFT_209527 [Byssothecium circinans]
MATNWQPPFGLPFAFPPQTPQQQQPPQMPHEQQNGQDGSYQTPAAEGFANPWGSIPGLNMQSYGQNTQQSPYSPSGWPPPIPTPDLAWHQAMQMQFPFMPPGAFPPPPLPGLPFPAAFPQTPSQNAAHAPVPALSPAAQPFQPSRQPALAVNDRVAEVMDSDKEDGEVSEGDRTSQPPAVNGSASRGTPRSAPQTSARSGDPMWKGYRERYNPEQPSAGHSVKPPTQQEKVADTPSSSNGISQQREEAKQFVKLLHSNNIGYRALAAEDLDPAPLRDLYRSLNLPSEPEPVPSPKTSAAVPTSSNAPASVPSTNVSGAKANPSVKVNIAGVPPAKSAPSPVDRRDYIARLQAAKKGKQAAAAAKATPLRTTPPAAPSPSVTATHQSNGEDRGARNTQIIKERIIALQNKPASPASISRPTINGTSSATVTTPSTTHPQPPSSVANNLPKPHTVPTMSFSGIPGLFMNSSPAAQAVQDPPNPRKRPLASDPTDPTTPIKRSDTGPTAGDTQHTSLPSRPASVKAAPSATSTPGAQTPGSQARAVEEDDKAKELRAKELAAVKLRARQNILKKKEETRLRELAKAAEESSREAKRLRREKLRSDLANVEAEEAANQAGILKLQDELARLQAHNEKMRQDKAKLAQELEELGINTEGLTHAALQARKDEIDSEHLSASVPATRPELPLAGQMPATDGKDNGMSTPSEALRNESEAPPHHSVQHVGIPGLGVASASASQDPSGPSLSPVTTNVHAFQTVPERSVSPAMTGTHALKTVPESRISTSFSRAGTPRQPVIAKLAGEKNAETDATATPMDTDEDFYSPKPAEEPPAHDRPEQTLPTSAPKSPSEDGEIAMSESEEEYEPDEPQEPLKPTLAETTHVPISERPASISSSSASSSSDEEETYEPPDVDFPMSDAQPRDPTVDAGESGPQGDADDGAMDISSSDESDDTESSVSSDGKDVQGNASNGGAEKITHITDDLAPELQADAGSSMTQDQNELIQAETDPWAFVPYESPLRSFKSYRYHPSYMQEVSGGFMSMTYSHQIDDKQMLCPTEGAGDTCSDPQCEYQHFHNMNLNGEKLLVQLGTANPGKTPEERQRWNEGLRQVLKDLRQKNTKDPNGIAIAIAQYRRRFLNDDTRVVNL